MVYGKRIGSIELRHLRYFVAIAEAGTVTKAAARLGIQQPPLSQQLRALETAIGTALFKRSVRGVALTKAGEHLLNSARTVIELIDDAVKATREMGLGKRGRLRIGYTSSAAFHRFVPDVFGAFRQAYPDIALNLHESCTSELIEALDAAQVDAAFVRAPIPRTTDLIVEPLVEEPMLVAAPVGHHLARRSRTGLCLTALAEETLLLYRREPGPGLYDTIVAACRTAGFTPRLGQEAPRMIGALNLVASGHGITLVPDSMKHINCDAIRYVRLTAASRLTAPIHLAYRPDAVSPAARLFIDRVRAHRTAAKPDAGRAGAHQQPR